MSHIIVDLVRNLRVDIENQGTEINGTMELVGVNLPPLFVNLMNLPLEENNIRDYYSNLEINLQAIRSLEHNLYEFIYRGLRQSVEQLLYFDKTQDYTSRRFVFSTTDCISHLQVLYRKERASLFAHIRSTDVVKLLPWDLLFLCKLTNRILLECEFPEALEKRVIVTIASAHYYLKPGAMY